MNTNHRLYTEDELVTVFCFSDKDLNEMHKHFSAMMPKRLSSLNYHVENFRQHIDVELLERIKSMILEQDEDEEERKRENDEKLEEWRAMELKKEKNKIKNNKKIQKRREKQKLKRVEQQEDALVRKFEKKLSKHYQGPKQNLSQEVKDAIITFSSVIATK
jgi:uncharacterized protein with gpF-like domain